ncbi:condensation domain-containing protein, partial [Nocardia asteroides]|uniref:condensation domain-containing protein n=1 Tax=Nocardia asteroides TaxID=1824 RepID=UPI00340E05E7
MVPINTAQYVDIHGDLDIDTLERASIVAGLEFGSGFIRLVEVGREICQYVDPDLPGRLDCVDVRDAVDPEIAALTWMRNEYSQTIDLMSDRLVRTAVIRVGDQRWFWYSCAHHIVLDGYGAASFTARIAELYTAAVTGVDAPDNKATDLRALYESEIAYRDSSRFESDKQHWAQRVAGLEGGSSLTGRSAPPSPVNDVTSAALSPTQEERLTEAVSRQDSTLAGLFIAGFAAYLAQFSGTEDVVLSLTVTARTTAVMRRAGGSVANIVPLRLRVGHDTTVAELLRAVTTEVSGALRH